MIYFEGARGLRATFAVAGRALAFGLAAKDAVAGLALVLGLAFFAVRRLSITAMFISRDLDRVKLDW